MNPSRESARDRRSKNPFPKSSALMRDRNGHWTAQAHDALRHLTDVYDNIGRHTHLI
jgi:hypothetical protein